MKKIFACLLLLLFLIPGFSMAQEIHQDLQEILKLKIIAVVDETEREIYGTDTVVTVQTLTGEILQGDRSGEEVTFENELTPLEVGDKAYVNHMVTFDGFEYYIFKDFDRSFPMTTLGLTAIVLLLWFAGKQGFRALLSLGISVAAIFFLLVPVLLAGYSPALASLLIAGVVLAAILFITHGVNARSTIAFVGTLSAVALTCLLAWIWVDFMRLTGFGSEEAIYLNFSTNGRLDLAGLLLGSIIIGILGVLDDVSITQASIVQELKAANKNFNLKDLYSRSIRVGRDHVGSLVNTLAFAYVGVALPLVLLLVNAEADLFMSLNQEIVAAEITRIVIGTIGLILAVPLTTLIAAWWFSNHEVSPEVEIPHHCGHSHK